MNEILLYFAIKYEGDFEKIYNITADDLIGLCQYMGVIGETTKISYIKKSQRSTIS